MSKTRPRQGKGGGGEGEEEEEEEAEEEVEEEEERSSPAFRPKPSLVLLYHSAIGVPGEDLRDREAADSDGGVRIRGGRS